MWVKMGIFPKWGGENKKYSIWNHHLAFGMRFEVFKIGSLQVLQGRVFTYLYLDQGYVFLLYMLYSSTLH